MVPTEPTAGAGRTWRTVVLATGGIAAMCCPRRESDHLPGTRLGPSKFIDLDGLPITARGTG